ncbi:MAG: protein kinase domain-containing protein, partial [Burkholderiales bacterium]
MTPVASNAERINRFRLLRPLGQGAQGIVYAAHDPELDRQVAIKTLLLNGAASADQAEQFVAAAKTASSLSHPNIVPVFEVGIHAGQPFVVFEYVEGRTLAAALEAEGPLPMARAVVMMSQILAGMAHVHASGLLHGDIKPANILIGVNNIPRVTDFGIARPARTAALETVSCGTLQYTAPECLSEGRADYRSDVFALGLLFHEMLTGEPVYEAANEYSIIYRILNEIPPSPSASNPRIDRRLDDIVLKALQREPDQRYADANQMKLELDRYRVPAVAAASSDLREQALHGTVEFLLRRMALKSDFPALTASFNRINQLAAQSEDGSIKAISDLVMRDFALSQKLLRIANSSAFGAGNVTRISQAITLLG